jgi:hypothetical protein
MKAKKKLENFKGLSSYYSEVAKASGTTKLVAKAVLTHFVSLMRKDLLEAGEAYTIRFPRLFLIKKNMTLPQVMTLPKYAGQISTPRPRLKIVTAEIFRGELKAALANKK